MMNVSAWMMFLLLIMLHSLLSMVQCCAKKKDKSEVKSKSLDQKKKKPVPAAPVAKLVGPSMEGFEDTDDPVLVTVRDYDDDTGNTTGNIPSSLMSVRKPKPVAPVDEKCDKQAVVNKLEKPVADKKVSSDKPEKKKQDSACTNYGDPKWLIWNSGAAPPIKEEAAKKVEDVKEPNMKEAVKEEPIRKLKKDEPVKALPTKPVNKESEKPVKSVKKLPDPPAKTKENTVEALKGEMVLEKTQSISVQAKPNEEERSELGGNQEADVAPKAPVPQPSSSEKNSSARTSLPLPPTSEGSSAGENSTRTAMFQPLTPVAEVKQSIAQGKDVLDKEVTPPDSPDDRGSATTDLPKQKSKPSKQKRRVKVDKTQEVPEESSPKEEDLFG